MRLAVVEISQDLRHAPSLTSCFKRKHFNMQESVHDSLDVLWWCFNTKVSSSPKDVPTALYSLMHHTLQFLFHVNLVSASCFTRWIFYCISLVVMCHLRMILLFESVLAFFFLSWTQTYEQFRRQFHGNVRFSENISARFQPRWRVCDENVVCYLGIDSSSWLILANWVKWSDSLKRVRIPITNPQ